MSSLNTKEMAARYLENVQRELNTKHNEAILFAKADLEIRSWLVKRGIDNSFISHYQGQGIVSVAPGYGKNKKGDFMRLRLTDKQLADMKKLVRGAPTKVIIEGDDK